jgi:hypothetical protein
MINRFPITVHTLVAAFFFNPMLIYSIPLTHSLKSIFNGAMTFLKSACHSSHTEAALQVYSNPYGAIGTIVPYGYIAKVFQFHVCVCVRFRVLVLVHVRVLVSYPCPYPCPCPCPCLCPCPHPCPCQFKYGAKNISVRHDNYIYCRFPSLV